MPLSKGLPFRNRSIFAATASAMSLNDSSVMGVSLAPASVNELNIPGLVFRPLRSKGWSSVDVWTKLHPPNPVARVLLAIALEEFSASEPKSP
jgi:hypothetical protein